jgi:uncharacterized membrane protein YbhN (UPF0104 family)
MPGLSRLLRWLPFGVLAALVAYVVIAEPFDWQEVYARVSGLSAVLWLQLLLVFLCSYGARIWRWALFTRVLGVSVPLLRNAVIYMAGFGMGLVFLKAGEAMRVLYLRPYGMSYPNGLGAFLADRLLDVLVAGLLACAGIAFLTGHSDWALLATGVCLAALWTLRSALAREWVRRLPLGRLSVYAQEGMHAMTLLLSGKTLWRASLLSVAVWCVQGSALYFSLSALGAPVAWHLAVAVYAIGLFAGAAAILPGGLGAAEAAITLLLIAQGVDKETAVAAAIISRAVPQWTGMAVGLLSLLLLGSASDEALAADPRRASQS